MSDSENLIEARPGFVARAVRVLRPSHEHTAFSATILLTTAVMLSRVIGYLREAYTSWAFGANVKTDVYFAAFTLPDFLNYLLAGGAISITFISILTRYTSEKREEEAHKAFSVIITVMSTALLVLIGLAEIYTPEFTRWWFPGFTSGQVQDCVHLTRVLLPAQIFFIIGGVTSAVLQSKRLFLIPALAPVIYNAGIILGGITLGAHFGIASLAYGAVAGSFLGPFLINAIGASKAGARFQPSFRVSHPAFLEWLRLSIPLMLGVSLVVADEWIFRRFASFDTAAISHLNYAKRLVAVPIAVLGQATGQASLPFFAKLFGEKRFPDFQATVGVAVYRVAAFSLLVSGWMMASALPLVDLLYRFSHTGRFKFPDSQNTAALLFIFGISLAFWAAQGLYARAFYAAGNTVVPMIAGTIITAASYPLYSYLFQKYSVIGLAIASDIGIAAHTLALIFLLHYKKLVPLGSLPWSQMLKALGTAVFAGTVSYFVGGLVPLTGSRRADVASLALVSVTWAAAAFLGLWITKSDLLRQLRRKRVAA